MNTHNTRIEKVGRVWFVVVAQKTGVPLKFLCETEGDAKKFLSVFQSSASA
jgi:hypothetical protein